MEKIKLLFWLIILILLKLVLCLALLLFVILTFPILLILKQQSFKDWVNEVYKCLN